MTKGDILMIKTVKGKVLAGTLAFGLVAGTGVAFGATDAGTQLKAWYDGQFGQASAKVNSDSDAYLKKGLEGMQGEIEVLKKESTNKILKIKDDEVASSTAKIDKQAKEHIDSITTKKIEIEGYMDSEFGKLKTEADDKIFKAGTDISAKAHKELGALTKQTGIIAQKSVQIELGAVKDRVVDEVEKAINAAKQDLQAQLDTKATATTEEIKGLVDKRVVEVRYFVTAAANFMVQEQQELIEKKAQAMEDSAMKAMEDLVSTINK